MKKILILIFVVLIIFLIYTNTKDKKIFYLVLGDELSLGMTDENYYKKSYTEYINEYLQNQNNLQLYIDNYATNGYRITDIINDIKNNKEIKINNKPLTINNALVKSDLLIISIGTNDITSKINNIKNINKIDYENFKNNIIEITKDYELLLQEIKKYCKEKVIIVGINIETENEKMNELLKTANNKFKEITKKYNTTYIDLYNLLDNKTSYKKYPTELEYKIISNTIIDIINNNVLN